MVSPLSVPFDFFLLSFFTCFFLLTSRAMSDDESAPAPVVYRPERACAGAGVASLRIDFRSPSLRSFRHSRAPAERRVQVKLFVSFSLLSRVTALSQATPGAIPRAVHAQKHWRP